MKPFALVSLIYIERGFVVDIPFVVRNHIPGGLQNAIANPMKQQAAQGYERKIRFPDLKC